MIAILWRGIRVLGYILFGLIALIVLTYVLADVLRTPSHDRNWKVEYQRLPFATFSADDQSVILQNVRDFVYSDKDEDRGKIETARYRDETYEIGDLDSLWYGISHFGKAGLAHSFLSFGFRDGRYLTLSFEARQSVDQHYNPLFGIFGAYELVLVAAEERDVIGIRSHVRKQPVYLYQIDLPQNIVERLFRQLMARINQIHGEPEFYHTITDNCTTSILRYAERLPAWRRYLDYRILLPGYSDQVGYDYGVIDNTQPFDRVRRAAYVDPSILPGDAKFSEKIRQFSEAAPGS